MRALIREGGTLAVAEIPVPEIRRPGDVVIRVLVAGICRTDLHVAQGRIPSANPITLGHELCGVIADASSARVAVGDLVTVDPAPRVVSSASIAAARVR